MENVTETNNSKTDKPPVDENWMIARLNTVERLPALPKTIQLFNAMAANPNCGVNDIIPIVSEDPVICANILKLANSSYFSGGKTEPIEQVDMAIVRIGFSTTRSIVQSTSLLGFFKDTKAQNFNIKQFWLHSIGVGKIAALIHEYCPPRIQNTIDPSNLQLAGTVHDIGKLLLHQHFQDEFKEVLSLVSRSSCTMLSAEKKLLEKTHIDLGAWMVKKWTDDRELYNTVRFHHNPMEASGPYREHASILHIADYLANKAYIGNSGNAVTPELDEDALKQLRFSEKYLELITREVTERKIKTSAMMSMSFA